MAGIDRTGEFTWRDIRGGLNRKNGGVWVETPIPEADGWYAACLLLRVGEGEGEGVTLAELRILPSGPGRYDRSASKDGPATSSPDGKRVYAVGQPFVSVGGGEWSRRVLDLDPDQMRGVTSRMLRKVPFDAIFNEALQRLNSFTRLPRGWDTLERSGRPGRAGRGDRHYAVWAQRYVEQAMETPRSPTKNLALKYGENYRTVSGWINEARERGLLSRPEGGQQGKSGGVLTAKAVTRLAKDHRKDGKP